MQLIKCCAFATVRSLAGGESLSRTRGQCYHCLAVPKNAHNVPSRRTAKRPMRAKVFSYYTLEERRLLEEAAKQESRSLSSFVALAALDRARRVTGRK
jgi:hypothetical protein